MTDKEKLQYLIGYLEGVIGGNSYITSVYVEDLKKAISKVSESI